MSSYILTIIVSAACGFIGGIVARQFDKGVR